MTRALRILGVGHIVVAVALLPVSMFLGVGAAPVLLGVPLWFITLGVWLFRPSELLRRVLRSTHVVAAPFAVWICAYGVFALRAAEKSAEGGGGLLGGFGFIPIIIGILSGLLSVFSLSHPRLADGAAGVTMTLWRFLLVACALVCGCESPGLRPARTDGPINGRVRVVFGGDLEFGNSYMKWEVEAGREDVLETRGYDYGLEKLAPLLRDADLVVVNLETPVTDIPESPFAGRKRYIHYNDPERAPAAMKRHNIGAVGLANNHTLDYGIPGLEQTFASLAREGIEWFGAGMNEEKAGEPFHYRAVVDGDTVTVLVAAGFEYAPWYDRAFHFFARDDTAGANSWTVERAAADVRRLREENPDAFIITFPHWGKNYWWRIKRQRVMAKAMIDAGADLILGHGAHVMQEVEAYRGRWIVYSLGNLHFNSPGRYALFGKDPYSFVGALDIRNAGGTATLRLRLYPIVSDNLQTDYQPRPVTEDECDIVEQLTLRQTAVPRALREEMRRGQDELGWFFELDVTPGSVD